MVEEQQGSKVYRHRYHHFDRVQDDVGALYYVVAVILIYGCSILMMIASYIRKNKVTYLLTYSLAIPPRVGKMSTGDDYGHRQGRNGEFCVTVGPVTRTADILTQSVIWRTWAIF